MKAPSAPAVVLVLACSLGAQEVAWTRTGIYGTSRLGDWIATIGDLDGDGFEDLLNHGQTLGAVGGHSQILFLSGRDGRTIRIRWAQVDPNYQYGGFCRAGDWDGDGVADYAVAIGNGTTLEKWIDVCSGADDRIMLHLQQPWSENFGGNLQGDLDLDGDRRPDLVVYAHPGYSRGLLYAFSNSGAPLYTLAGTLALGLGPAIDKVGDVDGDSCDDYVVGAGMDDRGGALLVSGRTGTIIRFVPGELPGDNLGYAVVGCGDLNGDGTADFAAGNSDFMTLRPVVTMYSGRDGARLWTWAPGAVVSGFGSALAGGEDIDRDGVRDIVVGAPGDMGRGGAYVFSGRDSTQLFRVLNADYPSVSGLGTWLTTIPAPSAQSFPLFVLCEPRYGSNVPGLNNLGRVRCYRGSPAGVQIYGAAGRGTLAQAPRIGLRDLGQRGIRIHVSNAEPGRTALLLLGLSRTSWGAEPLPMPLDPYGFPGCSLYTSVEALIPVVTGTTGVARGYASFDLPWPLASPGTLTIHAQWVCFGSEGTWPGGVSEAMYWSH